MQAFANDAFLDKRRKYAKWGNYIGLGALFIGLFTAARSPVLSSTLLLIGVLGASIGAYMANRYIREPRPDQLLARALDGLDKRYTLLSYYLPSDQVVFSHRGFTVLVTRAQQGEITYAEGRWDHQLRMRKIKQLFGEPAISKPEKDLELEVRDVEKWVSSLNLSDQVPVNGVIVFTGENVQLDVQDPNLPAVTLQDLASHFRDHMGDRGLLTTSQRREIESKLDALVGKA